MSNGHDLFCYFKFPVFVDGEVRIQELHIVPLFLELVVRHLATHSRGAVGDDQLVLGDISQTAQNILVGNKLRSLDHAGICLVLVSDVEDEGVGRGICGDLLEVLDG